jgi:hypothetical protein
MTIVFNRAGGAVTQRKQDRRTPMQTFLDSKPLAEEKRIA